MKCEKQPLLFRRDTISPRLDPLYAGSVWRDGSNNRVPLYNHQGEVRNVKGKPLHLCYVSYGTIYSLVKES